MMLEEVLLGTDGSKEEIWKFWNIPNPTSGKRCLGWEHSMDWTAALSRDIWESRPQPVELFWDFPGHSGILLSQIILLELKPGRKTNSGILSVAKRIPQQRFQIGRFISLSRGWDILEKVDLPLERVFAISDLFQGVLEPPELFLQGEREKKLIIFMGSLKANRVLSQPRNKTNPSSATYEVSNLEIHNNDKKPGDLLIIQHEAERKYQSYKNNTQSKRGKFSLPSWVSLIPEMVLGRAPASRILFCNQNLSRLNEEISSLHQSLLQQHQFSVAELELGIPASIILQKNPSLAFSTEVWLFKNGIFLGHSSVQRFPSPTFSLWQFFQPPPELGTVI